MSFLKDRINKRQQTHEKGYISFTEEELNEAKVNHQINAEAYSLLDAAMHTSSHITEQDRNGDECVIDNIYPCTEAECDEMDGLLDMAEKKVVDKNDSFFQERLGELRSIVKWSREKHWTFQWSLIGGCILAIFGFMYLRNDAKDLAAHQEQELQIVKDWVKQDTTITYEACPAEWHVEPLASANAHKVVRLANIKFRVADYDSSIARTQAKLDTCTSKDYKKMYKEDLKKYEKKRKEYRAMYDEVNDMKFKEYQKMIIKEEKADTKQANKHAVWMWIFLVYVIILIPAYIYYSHQYGYNITRHRTETKVLGGIQKVGFAIASFFLGAGLAMALLPDMEVTTHYSDGSSSKHTETDGANYFILAMKVIMIFIGLCIFAAVSVFLMTYVTVMAIKRQYDWSKVTAVAAAASQKAMDKVKESGIADKAIEAAKNVADKATEAAKDAADKVQEKIQEKKQEKENK